MFKSIKSYAFATPAILALSMVSNGVVVKSASANEVSADATLEQISNYSDTQPMSQVTSVSQLRDVSPTDWAFEALRSLVERYGCIVGYPDRTFRGNRALSRYEFAAGLNACMQQMERLIAASEAVMKEDIEKLKRLMAEFETELAALGARVDNLEGRVAFLEDHQFSTTTKLKGEVIMAVTAQSGPDFKSDSIYKAGSGQVVGSKVDSDEQATFSNRVRLSLDTSFTGKDLLRTRLAAGNMPNLGNAYGSESARLSFEQNTGNNDVVIDKSFYRTPLGSNATFWVGTALGADDIYSTGSPFTDSSSTGALARVNRYNPFIYRQPGESGIGLKYKFNKQFDITASYLAGDAANPTDGAGLFDGAYSTGVQLGFRPSENLNFSVAYMHSYFPGDRDGVGTPSRANLTGSTGSNYGGSVSRGIAALDTDPTTGGFRGSRDPFSGAATVTNNVGLQASWRIAEKVNLAGWVGWAFAQGLSYDSTGANRDGDNADLFTWSSNLSFLDLGKEGSVLTFAGGQVPRAGSVDGTVGRDRGQSWIVEGQYLFPVTNNISITPGVYAVFDPNNTSSDESTIVVGVLRTVFKF